jgi:site-specific DNA recombinase
LPASTHDRLQNRLHAIYIDKLDGRIDNYFFDKLSEDFRLQQDRCLRQIARHQDADQSYLEEGIGLLEMARSTQRLFENEQPLEKRRLLNFVLSNSSWKDGALRATFRQPFDLIANGGGDGRCGRK